MGALVPEKKGDPLSLAPRRRGVSGARGPFTPSLFPCPARCFQKKRSPLSSRRPRHSSGPWHRGRRSTIRRLRTVGRGPSGRPRPSDLTRDPVSLEPGSEADAGVRREPASGRWLQPGSGQDPTDQRWGWELLWCEVRPSTIKITGRTGDPLARPGWSMGKRVDKDPFPYPPCPLEVAPRKDVVNH